MSVWSRSGPRAKFSSGKSFRALISAQKDLVRRAADLAKITHAGQFRRDGVTPYLVHCEAVAARVAGDPEAEVVAWLHDVLEDSDLTTEALRENHIPPEVINRVVLLTNKGDIAHERYLAQIRSDPIATKVKVADILTNLNDHPSERQIAKLAKALVFLLS